MGEFVVDQLLFRFSICGSIGRYSRSKLIVVRNCEKNLDGFLALPNFRGQAFQKLYPGCALGSLGQSLAHVKISGHSPRKGENTVSRKMRTTVSQYSRHVTRLAARLVWIKVCDGIPISSELIDVYTLNFKPNFKFSRLKILGRPPSQLGCALVRLGQSLARVKI